MNNTIIPYTPEYYEQTTYNRYLIRQAQKQQEPTPAPVPYLPTELMNKIFDYKLAMEHRDKHKALTKALIVEYLDLPFGGVDHDYNGLQYMIKWAGLFNETFCWIDNDRNMKEGFTQCRDCGIHCHPDWADCECE